MSKDGIRFERKRRGSARMSCRQVLGSRRKDEKRMRDEAKTVLLYRRATQNRVFLRFFRRALNSPRRGPLSVKEKVGESKLGSG